jgi:histone arginine demethylase JMJD6
VGEDDYGNTVYVRYKHFAHYCQTEALKEDSPLYIFDSNFAERKSKSNPDRCPLASILNDYQIPPYFDQDLFKLVGESRRPPHRWIVMGPARSGTG